MNNKLITFPITLLFLCVTNVQAQSSLDEDLYGYDFIVKELSQSRASAPTDRDMLSSVMIHGGVGYASSQMNLKLPAGVKDSGFIQGIEAHLGIDLFSRYWLAEGAVRSYSNETFGTAEVGLHEFDLRLIYRNYLSRYFHVRTGLGLAARYLTYQELGERELEYTTPSSIFMVGIVGHISKNISLGVELSARNAMVSDTIDDQTLDATVRLGTHF